MNIGDYSLVKTEVVSDLSNPITSIPITAGFSEGTTYSFIVRDEDPAGRLNSSLVAGTIAIGDLTAPSFSGISGLALGSPSDTRLVASWTAIASDASGASNYLLYQTSSSSGTPADPCGSSGTLTNTIDATQYTTGNTVNFTVTGLTPRTNYKVCVKAVDAAGNISSTSVSAARTTQDITAPAFDGVQSITYNSSSIQVGWNASPTSDIKEYKIKLWKNTATPNSGDITTLTRAHSSFSTGFSFTSSVFSFTDNDTVYAVVDACDDASPTYGTQNCTAFANSTAKNVLVPDATPPASFVGIKDATQLTTPAEGQVTVTWFAPSSWTDYRGFNIYTVNTGDNSITFLKDCPCSGNNCPNQITSCTVTGLDARRTYTFHVRAYDAAGNITTYLDPASNRSAKLTTDTTSPTFSSNLQSSIAAGVTLS